MHTISYLQKVYFDQQSWTKCNVTPADFVEFKTLPPLPLSMLLHSDKVNFKLLGFHFQSLRFTSSLNLGKGGRGYVLH